MSEQQTLFPHICKAQDDEGTLCQNEMTEEEIEQDGMCCRCAEEIWASVACDDHPQFIMLDPKTRELRS